MITNQIKELAATKQKIVALEKSIAARLDKELATLPSKYGFASADAFAKAVKAAAGGATKPRKSKPAPAKAGGKKTRKKRVPITDAIRADVKKLVEEGKTGPAIAKALNISAPSVHNIKKALGLVKAAS